MTIYPLPVATGANCMRQQGQWSGAECMQQQQQQQTLEIDYVTLHKVGPALPVLFSSAAFVLAVQCSVSVSSSHLLEHRP